MKHAHDGMVYDPSVSDELFSYEFDRYVYHVYRTPSGRFFETKKLKSSDYWAGTKGDVEKWGNALSRSSVYNLATHTNNLTSDLVRELQLKLA